jgi:acyl-coenzyme A synthetase/AMP-(fatty) acid ligase
MVKSGTAENASSCAESKVKNGILDRWREVVARNGAASAVLLPDGGVARTFLEIEAESAVVAGRLAGIAPGAVVSLQSPNTPSWPALLLGIWKAGGCALLVDHTSNERARNEAERSCGARLRLAGADVASLDHAAADFAGLAPDLIKLTSGTGGAPRAILFAASQLEADCDNVCETMGIASGDVNYGVVAFSHSYGFSNLVTPLLCRGIPVVAAQDALPRAILAGVAASGASVLPAVPAIFHALAGVEGALPGLRLCISAGAPLRPETARAFRERFGRKVHTFYGASECGGITYDATEDEIGAPGFVGQPLRGVRIEPCGEGRVRVRGAAVGLGYFPGQPDDALAAEEFRPADLLAETASGWRIEGRTGDLINVAGKKVSPGEIEQVLATHPAVLEAVVFGVEDDARNESVCAFVVADAALDTTALREFCAGRLAPWQVPRVIVQLDAIPVNARGKVSRLELGRRFAAAIPD